MRLRRGGGVDDLILRHDAERDDVHETVVIEGLVEVDVAAEVRDAKRVAILPDAVHDAGDDPAGAVGVLALRVAEAQRIGGAEDARAHAVNIADDAADAGGSALDRQDLRRVVVALMRHHDAPAATVVLGEEDDAGVLLRAEDHVRRVGRQELQRGLRGLVGAVLAPLHVEDMQLNEGRVAADKLRDPPGLADRQPYAMLVESGLKLFIVHLRHCYLSFVEFHQGSPLHQRVPK